MAWKGRHFSWREDSTVGLQLRRWPLVAADVQYIIEIFVFVYGDKCLAILGFTQKNFCNGYD